MQTTEAPLAPLACELRWACEEGGQDALRECVLRWGGMAAVRRLPPDHGLARIAVRAQLVSGQRWLTPCVHDEFGVDPVDLLQALVEETGGVRPGFVPREEVACIVAQLVKQCPALGKGGLLGIMVGEQDAWAVLAAAPPSVPRLETLWGQLPDNAPLSLAAFEWGLVFARDWLPQDLERLAARYVGARASRLPPEDFNRTKRGLLRAALYAAALRTGAPVSAN